MSVAVRVDRKGDHASLVLTGPFDLAHTTVVGREVESAEALVSGCRSVDVDLAQLDRIDGAGAVLLARSFDRLDAGGCRASIVEGHNVEAARLIALYRERRAIHPAPQARTMSPLMRIGALAAQLPAKAIEAFYFPRSLCRRNTESGHQTKLGRLAFVAEADSRDRCGHAACHKRRQPAGGSHHRVPRNLSTRALRCGRSCS